MASVCLSVILLLCTIKKGFRKKHAFNIMELNTCFFQKNVFVFKKQKSSKMIRLRKKIPAAAQHSVVHGIFKICRRGPPKPCLTSAGFLSNSLFILWNIVSETWHDLKARNYLRETLVSLSQELNQKCSYNCQQKLYPHLPPLLCIDLKKKTVWDILLRLTVQ